MVKSNYYIIATVETEETKYDKTKYNVRLMDLSDNAKIRKFDYPVDRVVDAVLEGEIFLDGVDEVIGNTLIYHDEPVTKSLYRIKLTDDSCKLSKLYFAICMVKHVVENTSRMSSNHTNLAVTGLDLESDISMLSPGRMSLISHEIVESNKDQDRNNKLYKLDNITNYYAGKTWASDSTKPYVVEAAHIQYRDKNDKVLDSHIPCWFRTINGEPMPMRLTKHVVDLMPPNPRENYPVEQMRNKLNLVVTGEQNAIIKDELMAEPCIRYVPENLRLLNYCTNSFDNTIIRDLPYHNFDLSYNLGIDLNKHFKSEDIHKRAAFVSLVNVICYRSISLSNWETDELWREVNTGVVSYLYNSNGLTVYQFNSHSRFRDKLYESEMSKILNGRKLVKGKEPLYINLSSLYVIVADGKVIYAGYMERSAGINLGIQPSVNNMMITGTFSSKPYTTLMELFKVGDFFTIDRTWHIISGYATTYGISKEIRMIMETKAIMLGRSERWDLTGRAVFNFLDPYTCKIYQFEMFSMIYDSYTLENIVCQVNLSQVYTLESRLINIIEVNDFSDVYKIIDSCTKSYYLR